jgi:hypothetical protein
MFLKVVRYALIMAFALLSGRAALAEPPAGAELVVTPDDSHHQFGVASKEGCCKVWILIQKGDTATRLNGQYGNGLVQLTARLQLDSWVPIDFMKLSPEWQTAIRNKLPTEQGREDSLADQLTSIDEAPALTSSPAGTGGDNPSQQASSQVSVETSETGGNWPTDSFPMLLIGLWSLVSILLLMMAIHLARRIDNVLKLLREGLTGAAKGKDQEVPAAAEKHEKAARELAQVTQFDPSTDLLTMAQEIAKVVTRAGERYTCLPAAPPWTIFTWDENWNALLEEHRNGELSQAKNALRLYFGDLNLVGFINQVVGLLSAMGVQWRNSSALTEDPEKVSLTLGRLAQTASKATEELAKHSGLPVNEAPHIHFQRIRETLDGHNLQDFIKESRETAEMLSIAIDSEKSLNGKISERERQLRELAEKTEGVQELLKEEGFQGGDFLAGLQALRRKREMVRTKLRELAGDNVSGSEVEVVERVKQQLAKLESGAQESRSKLERWMSWRQRLSSALGYRLVDHEQDEPPATSPLTGGAWWDLRLGFLVMLKGWPAEVTNVPPEVRKHLRIDEVRQKALELVGLLEDLGGKEAPDERDRMWEFLKLKAAAINDIVRAREFLRTYYPKSAPAFQLRLAIGVAALELAFSVASARLVKVELLSLASVDQSLFDVEHLDEDLRPLEGPRAKIIERLVRGREGGFSVDMVACAFEREGEVAVRGLVAIVTPGTWIEFLS